ncbi:hypothetical protein [Adhaeribacter pallidiroseus]|uniref:Lipoprotein n=1 Tax=Adhaeribacter pallidiroseus TaxID=2072847 RepID=A0A369QH62_9BACT|nr:hypothetical protein [Adhaeribacter pallidiroseus]RDC62556.1 hypothetical protein AHMF7616_01150 [Adhaeribacter pallidiroseus]
MKLLFTSVFCFFGLLGCTTNQFLTTNQYTNADIPLSIVLPESKSPLRHTASLQRSANKRFNKYAAMLTAQTPQKILFYSGGADNPDQVLYTAVGSVISLEDTVKIKNAGFANRQVNAQPYLHKTTIDKANKVVSSEYIVKMPKDYFYLFASAPITKAIRQNEEAMIIVQDSLNRKYAAAIGTLKITK